jgi:hypothetical protein
VFVSSTILESTTLEERATLSSALGDPIRLPVLDELTCGLRCVRGDHRRRPQPAGPDIERVTDYTAIAAHGVMSTPALVIDEQAVLTGRVPVAELQMLLIGALP